MTELIYDYVENVTRRQVDKIIHLEDFIEMSPVNQEKVDCTYSLYEVFYKGGDSQKYVNIMSNSANMIIPADPLVLQDLFPSYLDDNKSEA
jgi:hypothetical protein